MIRTNNVDAVPAPSRQGQGEENEQRDGRGIKIGRPIVRPKANLPAAHPKPAKRDLHKRNSPGGDASHGSQSRNPIVDFLTDVSAPFLTLFGGNKLMEDEIKKELDKHMEAELKRKLEKEVGIAEHEETRDLNATGAGADEIRGLIHKLTRRQVDERHKHVHEGRESEMTILHVACQLMNSEDIEKREAMLALIEYLITKHGRLIDLPIITRNVEKPQLPPQTTGFAVHIAVNKRDLRLLKLLVECGADIDNVRAAGQHGETVLALAACVGDEEILKYLIEEASADPYARDSHGSCVLHILAERGYYDTSNWEEMLKREEEDKGSGHIKPSDAELGGAFKYLLEKMIQEKGPSPLEELNANKHTPLLAAVQKRRRHMVHALLEYSAERPALSFGRATQLRYSLTTIDGPSTQAHYMWLKQFRIRTHLQNWLQAEFRMEQKKRPELQYEQFLKDIGAKYGNKVNTWELDGGLDRRDPREKQRYYANQMRMVDDTALELAVKNEDMNLLSSEPVFQKLLEAKWNKYAKRLYLLWVAGAMAYVVLITAIIILIPKSPPPDDIARLDYFSEEAGTNGRWRFVLEFIFLLVNVKRLGHLLYNPFSKKRKAREKWTWWTVLAAFGIRRVINVLLTAAVLATRFTNEFGMENIFLGISAIFAWLSLLHYTRGSRGVGPLVMIFYRVVLSDLSRFVLLWCTLYFGFCEAMYLQMQPAGKEEWARGQSLIDEDQSEFTLTNLNSTTTIAEPFKAGLADWRSPLGALFWVIRWNLNESELDDLEEALDTTMAKIYWVAFSLITIILLLNVLIAMLNNTYNFTVIPKQIIAEQERRWHLERAKIILSIDDRQGKFAKPVGTKKEKNQYYLDIAKSDLQKPSATDSKLDSLVGSTEGTDGGDGSGVQPVGNIEPAQTGPGRLRKGVQRLINVGRATNKARTTPTTPDNDAGI
ncbi:hypothetical protein HK097_011649 [Rhizophlyctis rosea]|uniref:Ion transport domain-containing protein n=1 Tax=Rhizophlyctis rosea TaxID=64517 RepID=A0AAD5S982_9FUNG|nr:hypothetical protein HK097_011649 [Rhizophlyctis rosea]